MPKPGMRVIDTRTRICGTVTIVNNGQFCVKWDNGMTSSFYSWSQFLLSGGKKDSLSRV